MAERKKWQTCAICHQRLKKGFAAHHLWVVHRDRKARDFISGRKRNPSKELGIVLDGGAAVVKIRPIFRHCAVSWDVAHFTQHVEMQERTIGVLDELGVPPKMRPDWARREALGR